LFDTVADFRRVANLFEIVSCDYWQKNFGYTLPDAVQTRMNDYLSTEAGRHHVLEVLHGRMKLSGTDPARIQDILVEEKLQMATGFFGGGHELIIGRRHFVDGTRRKPGGAGEEVVEFGDSTLVQRALQQRVLDDAKLHVLCAAPLAQLGDGLHRHSAEVGKVDALHLTDALGSDLDRTLLLSCRHAPS